MDRPWKATHAVSVDLARELIAAQFPSLASTEIEALGFGWDNNVFAVGAEWVFRFPRRQIAVPLLEVECNLLPVIAEQLPLPVPVPIYRGEASSAYPWPFAGYQMLRGCTACAAKAIMTSVRLQLSRLRTFWPRCTQFLLCARLVA